MSEQRTSLNIPLYRRDWTLWPGLLGGAAAGWLWHRPMNWPDAIISAFVGGAVLWCLFGSSLSLRLLRQAPRWISIGWSIVALLGMVWIMSNGLPFLFRLI